MTGLLKFNHGGDEKMRIGEASQECQEKAQIFRSWRVIDFTGWFHKGFAAHKSDSCSARLILAVKHTHTFWPTPGWSESKSISDFGPEHPHTYRLSVVSRWRRFLRRMDQLLRVGSGEFLEQWYRRLYIAFSACSKVMRYSYLCKGFSSCVPLEDTCPVCLMQLSKRVRALWRALKCAGMRLRPQPISWHWSSSGVIRTIGPTRIRGIRKPRPCDLLCTASRYSDYVPYVLCIRSIMYMSAPPGLFKMSN